MLYRSVILGVFAVSGMAVFAAEPQRTESSDREVGAASKTSSEDAAAGENGLAAAGGSGACCVPGVGCQQVTSGADCDALSGSFLGFASTCDSCPGACSFGTVEPSLQCLGASGTVPGCSDLNAGDCATGGGSFQGIDSTCANLTGACCFDGGCAEAALPNDCDSLGGQFIGLGSSCFSGPSPCSGSCCVFGDRCTDSLSACECTVLLGGVHQGGGTTCTDPTIACTNPTGACCLPPLGSIIGVPPGSAITGLRSKLAQAGAGTSCSASSTGAPCCEGMTKLTCILFGGTYEGNSLSCASATCSIAPCPGRGDCCVPHRSGGCADAACCEAVCRIEPQCCLGNGLISLLGLSPPVWDSFCVATARRVCDSRVESCSSCPGGGDCCQPNGSGGCTEEACCREVCAVDPYCCATEWDDFCAASASWSCGNTCLLPGDLNGDGKVDLKDYSAFETLITGP